MDSFDLYEIMSARVCGGYYNKKAEPYIKEVFKKDLFDAFDVKDNPKAEAAYRIAWNYGHAYGAQNIFDCFEDFMELIK